MVDFSLWCWCEGMTHAGADVDGGGERRAWGLIIDVRVARSSGFGPLTPRPRVSLSVMGVQDGCGRWIGEVMAGGRHMAKPWIAEVVPKLRGVR
jgi:hypothetical protein